MLKEHFRQKNGFIILDRYRITDAVERKDTILQKCWYVLRLDFFVDGQQSAGV